MKKMAAVVKLLHCSILLLLCLATSSLYQAYAFCCLTNLPLTTTTSSLQALKWPTLSNPFDNGVNDEIIVDQSQRNGLDPNYPWRFEGRFIFRPSLVRVSSSSAPATTLLSLFGYTLGGSVILEYDISPVGPYTEYVTMGGIVALGNVNIGNERRGILGLGQWGTNLYVSTQNAENVCKQVWGVPAQVATIKLNESGEYLVDGSEDSYNDGFILSGWENTRLLKNNNERDAKITILTAKRYGNIPIFWTPTIKALWAPILFPGEFGMKKEEEEEEEILPLHKLRLSASAVRIKKCRRIISNNLQIEGGKDELPLGIALVVDNVLIEISEQITAGV